MSGKKYLVYLDILGFERFAEETEEEKLKRKGIVLYLQQDIIKLHKFYIIFYWKAY